MIRNLNPYPAFKDSGVSRLAHICAGITALEAETNGLLDEILLVVGSK